MRRRRILACLSQESRLEKPNQENEGIEYMSKIFLADSKSNDVRIGRLLETFRAKIKAYPPGQSAADCLRHDL